LAPSKQAIGDAHKFFLSGCVPYLRGDTVAVDIDELLIIIEPDRRNCLVVEVLLRPFSNQTRFPRARISQREYFDAIFGVYSSLLVGHYIDKDKKEV